MTVCFEARATAAPPGAARTSVNGTLAEAKRAVDAYDYRGAERLLRRVRRRLDALPPSEAQQALRLSAVVALSLDRFREAEELLLALLKRSPGFAPQAGAWPPPWMQVFAAARRRVPDRYPPHLKINAPSSALAGRPLRVRIEASDPSGVDRVLVLLDSPSVTKTVTSTDGRHFSAVIQGAYVQPPAVRFWVEAYDRYGNGPGYYAAPRRPTTVPVLGALSRGARAQGGHDGLAADGARATGGELSGARATGGELSGARATGGELSGARATGGELSGARATSRQLSGARATSRPLSSAEAAAAAPDEETNLLERWWFWTIAGAVIVGAGVAVVATLPSEPSVVRGTVEFR